MNRLQSLLSTWRGKLVALLLAFALVPIAVMLLTFTLFVTQAFEDNQMDNLRAIARSRSATIGEFALDRKQEVERIASLIASDVIELTPASLPRGQAEAMPGLRDEGALLEDDGAGTEGSLIESEDSAGADRGPRGLRDLREKLQLLLWDQSRVEELLVIDLDGRVIASTHQAHEGKDASELSYFKEGIASTYVQPVFRSPITGRLSMVVSTPILDGENEAAGVLAARLNLDRLFRIVNDAIGLGDTGEIVVGKIVSDHVVFMAPTRHDPNAALQRRIALGDPFARPIQDGASGLTGAARRDDYRGETVLAAWNRVPHLEWGLVAKRDRAEVMTPVARTRNLLVATAILLALLATFLSVAVARSLLRPLHELREAADRISKGDLDVQVSASGRDEIGQLASSFERMVSAIRFFQAEAQGELDEEEYDGEAPE